MGRERGFERENGIEEAWLIGEPDWRGGVERGAGYDASERGQALGRGDKRCIRRAGWAGEVGAEADVSEGHTDVRVAELRVWRVIESASQRDAKSALPRFRELRFV